MDRTLKELGEDGFIELLRPIFERHTSGLPLGTGDDLAITEPQAGARERLAWTVDAMIEGTHFRFRGHEHEAEWLGRKLAASNLSDLASKGAKPRFALLVFGAPLTARQSAIEGFYCGLEQELSAAGARLIGGDTVRAPVWSLSLTLVGALPMDAPIASRDRAEPGQNVYVTGWPGCSAAGLDALEFGGEVEQWQALVRAHCCPKARVAEGRALVRALDDIAMLDVSDGVARDGKRIADRSGVELRFEEAALPIHADLANYAERLGKSARDFVLFGGEDYELLFTTFAGPEAVKQIFAGSGIETPVSHIGRVRKGSGIALECINGTIQPLKLGGFEHFA